MRVDIGSGLEMESSCYSVALLQGEAEIFHTPAYDIAPWLAACGQFSVEVFSDHGVEALHTLAPQFDCIVIGPNAIYTNDLLRPILHEGLPDANLLVLSQFSRDDLAWLSGDLALRVENLPEECREAFLARRETTEDEVLLHWPCRLGEPAGGFDAPLLRDGSAIRGIRIPPGDSGWDPVLEVRRTERRWPVLLRTKPGKARRIVVSELRLEPANREHRQLLENMVTYCAAGPPEVAVVQRDPGNSGVGARIRGGLPEAHIVAGKLRLQGAAVVELHARGSAPLPFQSWPLRAVEQVVLLDGRASADDVLRSSEAETWLRDGGTLVTRDDDGRLQLTSGADDALWVAERWASWFRATDPRTWLERVHRCRAVLSARAGFYADSRGLQPARLGLSQDRDHMRREVARMLHKHIGHDHLGHENDNIDHTISTTAAALDLDELVDGDALRHPDRLRSWLRRQFNDARLEDRLDIARALHDEDLFHEATAGLGSRPLSALAQTRLRAAASACSVAPEDLPALEEGALEHEQLLRELTTGRQLAAQYVEALVTFAGRAPDHPLGRLDGPGLDRALTTLVERGSLRRITDTVTRPELAEELAAEARALLAYFRLSPENTLLIRPSAIELPFFTVQAILRQAAQARHAEEEALAEVRPVRRARGVLGVAAFAAAFAAAVLAAVLTVAGVVDLVSIVGGMTTVFVVVFLLLALLLTKLHLLPERVAKMARGLSSGVMASVRSALGSSSPGSEGR